MLTINKTTQKISFTKAIVNFFTSNGLSAQEENCYKLDAEASL